jgi:hypothetical protein
MLYGTATAVALWLFVALLVFQPCGLSVPLVWPALMAAAFVAWTQVLMWMPYPLPLLRAFAAVVLLGLLVASPQVAVWLEIPETVLVCITALLIPLAYLAACVAVGRARCGDVPDWRWLLPQLRRIGNATPRRQSPFSSAARAQVWFEWRRHGRSLPFLIGILLPFTLLLLFVAGPEMPEVVMFTLLGVVLTPPVMACFAATTVSKSNPYVRDYYGVPAFTATRPMTSAALVAAKLKMAVWSTLAAWLLVLVAIPLALTLSGNWRVLLDQLDRWLETESPLRAIVIFLLAGIGLVLFTWKQLVQNLYIGLTGREWLIKGTVFCTLAFIVIIGPVGKWVADNRHVQATLWDALPWITSGLVCLKLTATAWIVIRLHRHRLVSDRALIAGAACWLLVVLLLFGLLAWLVPAGLAARSLLAFGAVLVIPLARPAAAPLALAWNRHR